MGTPSLFEIVDGLGDRYRELCGSVEVAAEEAGPDIVVIEETMTEFRLGAASSATCSEHGAGSR